MHTHNFHLTIDAVLFLMQSVKPPRYVAFPSGELGIRCRSRHFHLRFRPHLVVLKSGPSKNVEIILLAEFHIHGFARDLNLLKLGESPIPHGGRLGV